jgi:serine/threonine protein kinase
MFSESTTWGVLPAGFHKLSAGNGNRMIVRDGREREIDFSLCSGAGCVSHDSGHQGRGALRRLELSDGETALVRQYHHGGTFRSVTGQWFFTWPPRPFRELCITEELRRRGLRTVEVYAACVSRGYGPFYRGWLVTRELRDAVDLWSALQSGWVKRLGWQPILRAVAESLRALHREGVYHSDLNLKNILLRQEAGAVVCYIIDFDKAKLFLGKLRGDLIKRNLDRLLRSVNKLDPEREYFPAPPWSQLLDYYHEASAA